MKKQEKDIIHTVQLLEDLVKTQEQLLQTANEIIVMKTKLVKLSESQVEIYKEENSKLKISLTFSLVCSLVFIAITLISLFNK